MLKKPGCNAWFSNVASVQLGNRRRLKAWRKSSFLWLIGMFNFFNALKDLMNVYKFSTLESYKCNYASVFALRALANRRVFFKSPTKRGALLILDDDEQKCIGQFRLIGASC
jgi:hypothetical protein